MHNYVIKYVYYYNPLHVSSNSVLIIRRSNCVNTTCGIYPDLYQYVLVENILSISCEFDLINSRKLVVIK